MRMRKRTAPGGKDDFELLHESVGEFCKTAGYSLSPEANEILADIVRLKRLTGDFYCPCQTQHTPETVCVCQAVRNGLVDVFGACFCNLIVVKKG
jgi:ferredoxin-thioredoxin reductase catalytic subunit